MGSGGGYAPPYSKSIVMLNFKIENATDKFLEMVGGQYKQYNYQGTKYDITPEFLETADQRLQQSFGAFAAKQLPRTPVMPKALITPVEIGGSVYLPPKVFAAKMSEEERIKRQILIWAKNEKIVEEKLNYPRVFQALLTEPHNAFEYKKKTLEEHINLTLFVDMSVGYHTSDYMNGPIDYNLHNTIIKVAEKIKGVNVFARGALHAIPYKNVTHDYWTGVYRALPPAMKKKVIVFSQGCGSVGHYQGIPPKAVSFCTPFEHGRNCGCGQIAKAASAQQIMYYKIRNAKDLAQIK